MPEFEFTPHQLSLIRAAESTYVEACPGAGKTQGIVQRFIERPLAHPRKGVALISFTNAAIDEARQRCTSDPGLRESPNFIGTIDSFINRFLVGPTFLARRKIAPRFTENWAIVPHSQVKAPGVPWSASLDWFAILDRTAHLRVDRVPIEQRASVERLEAQQVEALEARAMDMWNSFVAGGVLSASAARVALREYLGDPARRQQLGELMADRFVEVIVDEVQDCSADDLHVLELLHDFGVTIIAVGDPDQSIYGFRGDLPVDLAPFLNRLCRGQRLDGNFRSSPAICSAVDSLRAGSLRDRSVGRHSDVATPVVLISYRRRQDLTTSLQDLLHGHNMTSDQLVVLAHSADHARVAAGSRSKGTMSSNQLVILASAHQAINDPTHTPQDRVAAMRSIERIIRELGTTDVVNLEHADYLEACGITDRAFREGCIRIAAGFPKPFDVTPSEFRGALLTMTESHARLHWSPRPLRSPKGNKWPASQRSSRQANPLAYTTIHGLKGRQSPAIALVLPEQRSNGDGVRQWCDGHDGEERRVLYVGASRAESLLIIAAHSSVHDQVRERLLADAVAIASCP